MAAFGVHPNRPPLSCVRTGRRPKAAGSAEERQSQHSMSARFGGLFHEVIMPTARNDIIRITAGDLIEGFAGHDECDWTGGAATIIGGADTFDANPIHPVIPAGTGYSSRGPAPLCVSTPGILALHSSDLMADLHGRGAHPRRGTGRPRTGRPGA